MPPRRLLTNRAPALAKVSSRQLDTNRERSYRQLVLPRGVIIIKVLYWLYFAGLGALAPYIALYFHDIGFSDGAIGLLLSINGVAAIIAPVLLTNLADLRLRGRTLLALLGTATGLAGLLLTAAREPLLVAAAYLIFALMRAPIVSLLDGLTFTAIASHNIGAYHQFRLWGSIGFLCASVLPLLVATTPSAVSAACIVCGAVIYLAAGALTRLAPPNRPAAVRVSLFERSRQLINLLRSTSGALLLALFFIHAAMMICYAYYGRLMVELGVPQHWFGVINASGVVVEVLMVLGLGRLIRRFGAYKLLVFGGAVSVIRVVIPAFDLPLPVLAFSQLLHGPIAVALYLLAPTALNDGVSADFRNSVQGVYAMTSAGLASITGFLAGAAVTGVFADDPLFGIKMSFVAATMFAGIGFLLMRRTART